MRAPFPALCAESHRFDIFRSNLAFIEEHNRQGRSWQLGVTGFADLTAQEFASRYLSSNNPAPVGEVVAPEVPVAVNTSVDWCDAGAYLGVRSSHGEDPQRVVFTQDLRPFPSPFPSPFSPLTQVR